jgi:hypothetical protein
MFAGGSRTGIPRALLFEEPHDSLCFAPTILSLTAKLIDQGPNSELKDRNFQLLEELSARLLRRNHRFFQSRRRVTNNNGDKRAFHKLCQSPDLVIAVILVRWDHNEFVIVVIDPVYDRDTFARKLIYRFKNSQYVSVQLLTV